VKLVLKSNFTPAGKDASANRRLAMANLFILVEDLQAHCDRSVFVMRMGRRVMSRTTRLQPGAARHILRRELSSGCGCGLVGHADACRNIAITLIEPKALVTWELCGMHSQPRLRLCDLDVLVSAVLGESLCHGRESRTANRTFHNYIRNLRPDIARALI
jgi:hypothetical protein